MTKVSCIELYLNKNKQNFKYIKKNRNTGNIIKLYFNYIHQKYLIV